MRRNILNMIKENNEAGLQANISQQSDEKFTSEASWTIGDLRKTIEESKLIKDSEQLMIEHGVGSASVKRLEELITKRFIVNSKARFTILADLSENAFAFPMTPNTSKSILKNNDISVEKQLQEALRELETYDTYGEVEKKTIDVNSLNGIKNLYNKIIKDSKTLEEHLKTNMVEFDLKNATITGLPDDFTFVIGIDLYYFLTKTELTDREIFSIMVHEIGHSYSVLLDLYRKAKTNVLLTDIMSSSSAEHPDKVFITLAKEFQLPTPKLDKNNRNKEILSLVLTVFETIAYNKTNAVKNSTASERFADQFPVRFGLGPEFFKAIKFFNNSTIYTEFEMGMGLPILDVYTILVSIGALAMFVIGGIAGAATMFPFMAIAAFIRVLMWGARIFMGTDDANETLYDDKKRRLESIRNDHVRRLNGLIPKNSADRELIKLKFIELDQMDKEIKETRKGRSILGILGESLFTKLRTKSRETLINEMLENMEANKLKVLSEKIKLSGGL